MGSSASWKASLWTRLERLVNEIIKIYKQVGVAVGVVNDYLRDTIVSKFEHFLSYSTNTLSEFLIDPLCTYTHIQIHLVCRSSMHTHICPPPLPNTHTHTQVHQLHIVLHKKKDPVTQVSFLETIAEVRLGSYSVAQELSRINHSLTRLVCTVYLCFEH